MTESNLLEQVVAAFNKVQEKNPFTPSITNSVTINFVANAQLAIGASAAMFNLKDENEYAAKIADSYYINLGTMFYSFEETVPETCKALCQNKIPWVYDPVSLGIGNLRSKIVTQMKEYKPCVVRANASEIIKLAKFWNLLDKNSKENGSKGVDSTDSVEDAKVAAKKISNFINGAVAVSGKVDFVTDGKIGINCFGGSEYFPKITGSGCSLGGVIACFCAVTNPLIAALAGTVFYNQAGIKAEKISKGTGTFYANFLDSLSNMTKDEILSSKIQIE